MKKKKKEKVSDDEKEEEDDEVVIEETLVIKSRAMERACMWCVIGVFNRMAVRRYRRPISSVVGVDGGRDENNKSDRFADHRFVRFYNFMRYVLLRWIFERDFQN